MARATLYPTERQQERAILVGVDIAGSAWDLHDSLAELERLAATDGAEVVGKVTQRLKHPQAATFIGKGKVSELTELVSSLSADVVIFDDELTPSQQSNLERALGDKVKVIDRCALILDIFGIHAKTHEGRLQVQLAQLQYVLPRLRGMWSHLVGEQTRGGIGSRFGQGESQLEVDRRLIRARISALKRDLKKLEKRRQTQSKTRWESGAFSIALAGYTNAGKSTLLNSLSGAGVYVQDELFATLDPTTRQITLDDGRKMLLSDTVGFIQKLPTTLVEAFKSTLGEVLAADLVLHVIDISDPNRDLEREATQEILAQIGAQDIDSLLVFNKCDLLSTEDLDKAKLNYPDACFISAQAKTGLEQLLRRISEVADKTNKLIQVCIPYDQGNLVQSVHERTKILHEDYTPEGTLITLYADPSMQARLAQFMLDGAELPS